MADIQLCATSLARAVHELSQASGLLSRSAPAFERTARSLSFATVFEPMTEQGVADAVAAQADRTRTTMRRLTEEAKAAVDALADKKRQLAREQRRRSADFRQLLGDEVAEREKVHQVRMAELDNERDALEKELAGVDREIAAAMEEARASRQTPQKQRFDQKLDTFVALREAELLQVEAEEEALKGEAVRVAARAQALQQGGAHPPSRKRGRGASGHAADEEGEGEEAARLHVQIRLAREQLQRGRAARAERPDAAAGDAQASQQLREEATAHLHALLNSLVASTKAGGGVARLVVALQQASADASQGLTKEQLMEQAVLSGDALDSALEELQAVGLVALRPGGSAEGSGRFVLTMDPCSDVGRP